MISTPGAWSVPSLSLIHICKDIIKPIGFHRESTALNDTDMKYLLLYLEETYGLTNEKKDVYKRQPKRSCKRSRKRFWKKLQP